MKTSFIALFFLPIFSIAQTTSSNDTINGEKETLVGKERNKDGSPKNYTIVEQMPEYRGGENAMMKFIADNFKIPKKDKENNTQGRILVKFVVNQKGKVKEAVIKQSVSKGLDKEALRVIKKLKFRPGYQKGKPVSVFYTIPLNVKY